MDRRFVRVIVALFYLGYIAAIWAAWPALIEKAKEHSPQGATGIVVVGAIMGALALLLVVSKLADIITVKKKPDDGKLNPYEIRERAEREGEAAVKAKEFERALKIYEHGGLTNKAVDIARQLNDKQALVRLYTKLGFHDRARRISVELKDYETAAQSSALMGEIDVARELYKEAAAAQESREVAPIVIAGLWDRAGDYLTAARLYEEASDLDLASECYSLLHDAVNAKRCMDSAKVLQAYERRASFTTNTDDERYRTDMAQGAKLLEAVGDFLGAGLAFRKAELLLEAAIDFERFQEWERAARAYDEVGLKDRAELARTRLPAITPAHDSSMGADSSSQQMMYMSPPSSAPLPANAPTPPPFVPVAVQMHQVPYAPVYASQLSTTDPDLPVKVAQRVRRGHFIEAAEFALEGNDWLMAAALYEQGGALLQAADLYRNIGKVTDAMFCLQRAGRMREAALLGIAMGQEEKARDMLLKHVLENQDQEAGLLLADILMREGKKEEAAELLRVRLAPRGINEETAALHYLFAQLLEKYGSADEAVPYYRELTAAGADSPELRERLAELDPGAVVAAHEIEQDKEFCLDSVLTAEANNGQTATAKKFKLDLQTLGRAGLSNVRQNVSLFGAPAAGADSLFDPVSTTAMLGPTVTGTRPPTTGRPAAAPVDPFSGAQRYELQREISRGGMGVVYEALDTALGRSVALKLILNQQASTEEFQQFLLEARAIARLNHSSVVTMYDIGLMDLKHYITMELVTGGSLGEYVTANPEGLPLKEALRIFVDIASGLQAAHDAGIVHRDIKPGNLLLTDKGAAKIVDFGLAKLGEKAGSTGETIFRTSGTPGYMAPEQIEGEESLPRVDIYALGIVLFFMLVGKPPHALTGRTKPRQIAAFQLSGTLPSLREQRPDVPPALEEIYRYCTTLEPDERYQSIHQFLPLAEEWLASL
ncbi:MAG: protein kinase domain-containing protein [Candidatus Sumerlaeaceae bacterium]